MFTALFNFILFVKFLKCVAIPLLFPFNSFHTPSLLIGSGEWKEMSERVKDATRLRLLAESSAGEAAAEAGVLQVCAVLLFLPPVLSNSHGWEYH